MDAQALLMARTRQMHESLARELIARSLMNRVDRLAILLSFDPRHPDVSFPAIRGRKARSITVELGVLYGAFSFGGHLDVELSFNESFHRVRIPFASMMRLEIPAQRFVLEMPLLQGDGSLLPPGPRSNVVPFFPVEHRKPGPAQGT